MNKHHILISGELDFKSTREGTTPELIAYFDLSGDLNIAKDYIKASELPMFYKWLDNVMGQYL
jgi:hypothetical protein